MDDQQSGRRDVPGPAGAQRHSASAATLSLAEKLDLLLSRNGDYGVKGVGYADLEAKIKAVTGQEISSSLLYSLHKGNSRNPKRDTMETLGAYFGVRPGFLFDQVPGNLDLTRRLRRGEPLLPTDQPDTLTDPSARLPLSGKIELLINTVYGGVDDSNSFKALERKIFQDTGEKVTHTLLWSLSRGKSTNPTRHTMAAIGAGFSISPAFLLDTEPGNAELIEQLTVLGGLAEAQIESAHLRAFWELSPGLTRLQRRQVADLLLDASGNRPVTPPNKPETD